MIKPFRKNVFLLFFIAAVILFGIVKILEKPLTKEILTIKVKEKDYHRSRNWFTKNYYIGTDKEEFVISSPLFSSITDNEIFQSIELDSTYDVGIYGYFSWFIFHKKIFEVSKPAK